MIVLLLLPILIYYNLGTTPDDWLYSGLYSLVDKRIVVPKAKSLMYSSIRHIKVLSLAPILFFWFNYVI